MNKLLNWVFYIITFSCTAYIFRNSEYNFGIASLMTTISCLIVGVLELLNEILKELKKK